MAFAAPGNVTFVRTSTRPGPTQLVDGEDQSIGRLAHVEADDVADLVDELRVGGELPGLHCAGFSPKARQIRDKAV